MFLFNIFMLFIAIILITINYYFYINNFNNIIIKNNKNRQLENEHIIIEILSFSNKIKNDISENNHKKLIEFFSQYNKSDLDIFKFFLFFENSKKNLSKFNKTFPHLINQDFLRIMENIDLIISKKDNEIMKYNKDLKIYNLLNNSFIINTLRIQVIFNIFSKYEKKLEFFNSYK